MIIFDKFSIKKSRIPIKNIIVWCHIKHVAILHKVFFLNLVKNYKGHVTKRQTQIFLLNNPIMVLSINSMAILVPWLVFFFHICYLKFSKGLNRTILVNKNNFIIGNDVRMTFIVPKDLIFLADLIISFFRIMFYVPVVESQIFVNFTYYDEQDVGITSSSNFDYFLSFFILWDF